MHVPAAFHASGSLNYLIACFCLVAQSALLMRAPSYLVGFRIFLVSTVLSNALYLIGVFDFWTGWLAPWHSAIYIAACLEAQYYMIEFDPSDAERSRVSRFCVAVGMLVAGVYWLRAVNPTIESATSAFCMAMLMAIALDIEESRWLRVTSFPNHAMLLLLWFALNVGANISGWDWFGANLMKLLGHAIGTATWFIVMGGLPAQHRQAVEVSRSAFP